MNLFNIGNIVSKFNKLQKEVDSYCKAQREEVVRLQAKAMQAQSDQIKGEAIAKALKAITGGE